MSATAGVPSVAEQMQQRIIALEQQVVAVQAKVPAQQSVKKPAIPSPKQFTGEMTGSYSIDEWIDEVEKHIRHHNTYFTSDAAVVDWASAYLTGKANGWWKSTQEERRATGQQIVLWADMKREMLERFHPIEAATLARMALDKMQQKGSVQSYTEYFYKQMNYIKDMSLADQLHHYSRGLKPLIRGEVLKAKPTSIHEAVGVANTAESFANMSQPQPRYAGRYQGASATNSGGVPMELGNVNQAISEDGASGAEQSHSSGSRATPSAREQHLLHIISELQKQGAVQQSINAMFQPNGGARRAPAGPRVQNVSKEDYERCRTEHLCIKCKKPGHIARDCTGTFSLKF